MVMLMSTPSPPSFPGPDPGRPVGEELSGPQAGHQVLVVVCVTVTIVSAGSASQSLIVCVTVTGRMYCADAMVRLARRSAGECRILIRIMIIGFVKVRK